MCAPGKTCVSKAAGVSSLCCGCWSVVQRVCSCCCAQQLLLCRTHACAHKTPERHASRTYQYGAANSFLYMPMDPILEQLAHFYSSEELASRIDALYTAIADGADVLDLGSFRLGLERVTGRTPPAAHTPTHQPTSSLPHPHALHSTPTYHALHTTPTYLITMPHCNGLP